MMDKGPIRGISNIKMVFPDTVIRAYSETYPSIEDESTRATFNVATLVNCKTLPTNITGLNGITPPDTDFMSNPGIGCYAYNMRGVDGVSGSTIELFG